jgi:hypothetical protein
MIRIVFREVICFGPAFFFEVADGVLAGDFSGICPEYPDSLSEGGVSKISNRWN